MEYSLLVKQVYEVVYETKQMVLKKLDEGEEVTRDNLNQIITDSIKSVARKNDVEDSVIYAAVRRSLGFENIDEFKDELFYFITGQNINLVDRLIEHRRITLDDAPQIKALFSNI